MRSAILVALAAMATASPALRTKRFDKPLVTTDALKADIKAENLMAGARILQNFADSGSNGTRLVGTPGHTGTVKWIKDELDATGYYNVELQTFTALIQVSSKINTLSIGGANVNGSILQFSPSGSVTAQVVHVPNQGCQASDYPSSVVDKIALISRGTCAFSLKSALAGTAGAKAIFIYNNVAEPLNGGVLDSKPRSEGPYVPSIIISQELGKSTAAAIDGGTNITATVDVTTDIRNVSTSNVVATTKVGNQDAKLSLGAHTDSAAEGPGLNDNGSGTIALVEVAKALSKYSVNNAVMFGFWSAEEWGLLGAKHYVDTLPEAELAKIRAYLNFDMIASKNNLLAIYDGSSTLTNATFPPGSAEIESLFKSYFTSSSLNSMLFDLTERSDHAPFYQKGVAVGGLFAGGTELKTEEQAKLFGGQAGAPSDSCYHMMCDNVGNLNSEAWEIMTRGIAHAVATYGNSWGDFPERNTTKAVGRRSVERVTRAGRMVYQ